MSRGELGPKATALAQKLGADAAAFRNAHGYSPACPYDRKSSSITERRLAVVWWDALLDNSTARRVQPLP